MQALHYDTSERSAVLEYIRVAGARERLDIIGEYDTAKVCTTIKHIADTGNAPFNPGKIKSRQRRTTVEHVGGVCNIWHIESRNR
jgi:hypothetical protein